MAYRNCLRQSAKRMATFASEPLKGLLPKPVATLAIDIADGLGAAHQPNKNQGQQKIGSEAGHLFISRPQVRSFALQEVKGVSHVPRYTASKQKKMERSMLTSDCLIFSINQNRVGSRCQGPTGGAKIAAILDTANIETRWRFARGVLGENCASHVFSLKSL